VRYTTDYDGHVYEVLPLEEALAAAQAMLDRLYGTREPLPEAEPGDCDECNQRVLARVVYGAFNVCCECLRRRQRVAGDNKVLERIT
jgi:hypothetical protein